MFDIISVPFGYALRYIYEFVGSYGLAIIIFTILTKLILYPLTLKSKKSMRQVQKLQPKMKELQKKYANNKQKYQEEVAKLYQQEKVNPAGSCLPTLLTLPIMLGLYYVIQQPLTYIMRLDGTQIMQIAQTLGLNITEATVRASEITIANGIFENFSLVSNISPNILPIDFNFLGINLALTPKLSQPSLLWIVPILSGVTALLSTLYSQKSQGTSLQDQPSSLKTMIYIMPLMSVYFGFILPAGVGIYWIIGNILLVVQEFFSNLHLSKHEKKEEAIKIEKDRLEKENRRREMELKKEEQRRISEENNKK